MNYIKEYNKKVQSGEIVACEKIKKVMKHLAYKVDHTDDGFHFNQRRGDHVIAFFERFIRHSKGKWGGQLVKLELWQKAYLQALFGFVDDNELRQYHRSVLIVAKKNGKSFMSSGIGLYLLTADGEPGPEIYSVANSRDQAKIVWSEAKRMRNKSEVLGEITEPTISEIRCPFNEGTFKPLASKSDNLDGKNTHGALMDEFHQWRNGRVLYNIIADGTTTRDQPLILMTSTAGFVRGDIYDDVYAESKDILNGYEDPDLYQDDRTLPFIYELDDREEWTNRDMWIKANPNLGVTKSYTRLAEKVERAKKDTSLVKNLLTKEFNIPETRGESWLSYEDIQNTDTFDLKVLRPDYGIAGVDLSKTTDLTSATVIFNKPNDETLYAESMSWIPSDFVYKKVKEDKVPYDKWIDNGWLRTSQGNIINYKDIIAWFDELREKYGLYLAWIGYDAWSATYFVDELKTQYGDYVVEKVHQGKRTLSSPMFALGADLKAHKVNYNNNPVLKWAMTNVSIDADKNGNIQPTKPTNPRLKIDPFASMLNAYVVKERHLEEYKNMIGD